MSGDNKEQPIIFYCKEMSDTKIALLSYYGVKFVQTTEPNNNEEDPTLCSQSERMGQTYDD